MKKTLLLLSMIALASCSNDDQETPVKQSKTPSQVESTTADQPEQTTNSTARYTTRRDWVSGDTTFEEGDALYSPNGMYKMYIAYGQIVMEKRTTNTIMGYKLFVNNYNLNGAIAKFQYDGNFVLYYGGRPIWASGTDGFYGSILKMQDDGNLVIYWRGQALWSSRYGGRNYRFPVNASF